MQLTEGIKANFETLKEAVKNGDLALVDAFDTKTNESVGALCAVNRTHDEVQLVPLAIMFYDDPFERLRPPSTEDPGYIITESEGGEIN